ncbi:hypothetical protein BGZ49_004919, partial [Haplosporangium sp. Z 27]
LVVRFGIKSYAVESKLPVYTPTPAPPVLLHSPTGRNAVPTVSAIKSTSLSPQQLLDESSSDQVNNSVVTDGKKKVVSMSGVGIQEDIEDRNKDSGLLPYSSSAQRKSPKFSESQTKSSQIKFSSATPPSSPMAARFSTNSPKKSLSFNDELSRKESGGSQNVRFSGQPGSLPGESFDSEESYPTFAKYRQSRHGFDMFSQRIKKALETANAQQREQQERERIEQERLEQQRQQQQELVKIETDFQNDQAGSVPQAPPTALSPDTLSAIRSGRPRSSSAASMISNLSEKIRLGTSFFGRSGRSRAGSDASSVGLPITTNTTTSIPNNDNSSSTLPNQESTVPTSSSSTTTMAAIASAAAVATAMSIPRHSATFNNNADNITKQSSHPLAQTLHVNDPSQDDSVVIDLNIPEGEADK